MEVRPHGLDQTLASDVPLIGTGSKKNKVRHELIVTLVRVVLLDGLHGDGPLLDEDGAGLRDGGVLDGPDLLLADPAVGAEEDLDADRHVVLPEQEHVLAEVLILFALESNEMEERN